ERTWRESYQVTTMATPSEDEQITFKSLGVCDVLCEACTALKWTAPTKIQREALPLAFEGRDVIGLAETGSGKTGAFALPILQALLETPTRLFALVLTPTRELAFQISEQFEALGAGIGVKCAVVVGGVDMMTQSLVLAKKPHIVIATPGRLVDHLENTKGFNLRSLKFLVMDEADRILNMDFEVEVNKILKVIPRERKTYLFSATMTKKVQKLQRASLHDPVKVEVSTKYQTVEKLLQNYLFIPSKYKDCYLVSILNELAGNSVMVFCGTCSNAQRTAILLRHLGFQAIPLHGKMPQAKRLGALNTFRSKGQSILVSTDVASRGLDIPHVDVVINFDIPTHSKDYIHRVGRTARAGRAGRAITFVTQYDVELYQRIEQLIDKKLTLYPTVEEEVLGLMERVSEAQRYARMEIQSTTEHKRHAEGNIDDGEEEGKTKKKRRKF
ncbi:hypothetical protein EMCRGX_G028435, partial [Ephydatia muelleri]